MIFNINFLTYFNPYVCNDGKQFVEAKEKGYLALNQEGKVYEVDFFISTNYNINISNLPF